MIKVSTSKIAASLGAVVAIVFSSACVPSIDLQAEHDGLMAADRAFDEATAADGADGWASFFADDGVQFPTGRDPIHGPAAVRDYMAPFFADSGSYLRWSPDFAEVSAGADLGYTYGTADGRIITPSGDTLMVASRYITMWRKDQNGDWKVVADLGTDR